MSVPSTPQDLINLIREKLFNNTSGKIDEPSIREVLEWMVKVLDAKFSLFSPELTEEQYSKWNLMLDYMVRETKGVLTTTSPAPTGASAKGKYLLSGAGTYTNLGGLVATADKLNYAYFDGTTWSLISIDVEMPETLVAKTTINPDVTKNYISSDFGVYSNFNGIEVWNEKVLFSFNGTNWIKNQIESYNGLSPKYNELGLTTENNNFMKYLKSVKLLQNFDTTKSYFISDLKYKNSGYTGILIYIRSLPSGTVEFIGEVANITLEEGKPIVLKNIHSNDADRYIKLELSKNAPINGFSLDGTYYQDGFLNENVFFDELETKSLEVNVASIDTIPNTIKKEKSYFVEENGVYANFNNIEIWGEEKAILSFDTLKNTWVKKVYDAGDFSINEVPQDAVVSNNIRKIIQNIKLVDGFNYATKYFISSIKYKEGGESGIYLLLRSLPMGAYEFETRIIEHNLVKGKQILLEDIPRNRKVLLTISANAPDTFQQNVTYYQDSLLSAKSFYDANYNAIFKPIKTTRITVPNNNDYAIRTLVHSLKGSANYYNRYVVVVPKGIYFEMDIRTGDYIDIEGVSAEDCIINLDGSSSKISPIDLTLVTGGVAISSLEQKYKHIFWHVSESEIRNLTLKVKNCKYAIHQDVPTTNNSKSNRIIIEDLGGNVRLVGIGGWSNQKQTYKDCYFKNLSTTQAIGWHNWDNQSAPAEAEFINCKSDYYFINITELGSNQSDKVRLVNCSQVNLGSGAVGFYVEPQDSTPPSNVPYCITTVMEGKELPTIQVDRPNFKLFK